MENEIRTEERRSESWWQTAQPVVSGLIVAAIIALFTGYFTIRDTVLRHDVHIHELREFKDSGKRFTAQEGDLLSNRIDSLDAENIRLWTSIRSHLEKGYHKEAGFRLRNIESLIRDHMKSADINHGR